MARKKLDTHEQLRAWQRSRNVAQDIDDNELGRIGELCVQEYRIDRDSRSSWEKTVKAALKDLLQQHEPKSYPFSGAANVRSPLLTNACLQFAARAYPAIVNSPKVVKVEVVGKPSQDTQARADRVEQYMSHQLLHTMDEWASDTDIILHQIPAVGCAFRKVYWSREAQRPKSEMISALNLIVNQNAASIYEVPRITEYKELYPHEIEEKRRSGFFLDIDPGAAQQGADGRPDARPGDIDSSDSLAPHVFLEQHRYLDLDGDGLREPWIVTVHLESRRVYRLAPNYDLAKMIQDDDGKIVRLPRFNYYVKYPFIPDPRGGFYDIGFGELLKSVSESVNSTMNQMLDAGHLQNAGGGFIGSGLNLKKTQFRFAPGVYHTVNAQGGLIRDAIVNVEHPGPSAATLQLLTLLLEWGKQITSVQDVLSGDSMPANQPAATTLAQIEQGLKVFTAIYKRVYSALTREYRLLYDLNARYPDDAQYARVLGISLDGAAGLPPPPAAFGELAPGSAAAQPGAAPPPPPPPPPPPSMDADFSPDDSRIVPQADPSMVTDQQRIAKAQVLSELSAHPVIGPQLKPDVTARRILMNIAIDNLDELLQQPNPAAIQANAVVQDAKIKELQARVSQLTADAGLKVMQAEKVRADIIVSGAKVQQGAQELASSDAHRAHEAALAAKESQEAELMAQHTRSQDTAAHQHTVNMDVLQHHAGREDADRQHAVDLLGLAASGQQTGGNEAAQ